MSAELVTLDDGSLAYQWIKEGRTPGGRSLGMRRFVIRFDCRARDISKRGSDLERRAASDPELARLYYELAHMERAVMPPPPQASAAERKELRTYEDRRRLAALDYAERTYDMHFDVLWLWADSMPVEGFPA